MRFLIDADCPRSIGSTLRGSGHDVTDIRDIDPAAPDHVIYALIRRESYILVTRDMDFSNILRYPVGKNFGIILLRLHLMPVEEIIRIIQNVFARLSQDDLLGSLTVVRRDRIRIHKF